MIWNAQRDSMAASLTFRILFRSIALPLAWLEASDPALVKQLAKALYRRYFIDNRNLGETEIVIETAAPLDIDKEAVTAALRDGDVKARLSGAVDEALEKGVFGAPFFIYGDEKFWGCDRMDHLDKWLETGGW